MYSIKAAIVSNTKKGKSLFLPNSNLVCLNYIPTKNKKKVD